MKRITLCNCIFFFYSFFFSFFLQPYLELRNCKLIFLILKTSQYWGLRRRVKFFTRYSCKNWFKNWYLHFYNTHDYQIWQAGTSTGFESNKTIQVGAGDVIMSRSSDKLKTFSITRVLMAPKLVRMVTYLNRILPIKPQDPLMILSCKITWQTKIFVSPLPHSLWPTNFARW